MGRTLYARERKERRASKPEATVRTIPHRRTSTELSDRVAYERSEQRTIRVDEYGDSSRRMGLNECLLLVGPAYTSERDALRI